MTPPDTIPTTPVPPTIDAARRILAAALDTQGVDPCAPELLAISEALAQLGDVTPP